MTNQTHIQKIGRIEVPFSRNTLHTLYRTYDPLQTYDALSGDRINVLDEMKNISNAAFDTIETTLNHGGINIVTTDPTLKITVTSATIALDAQKGCGNSIAPFLDNMHWGEGAGHIDMKLEHATAQDVEALKNAYSVNV